MLLMYYFCFVKRKSGAIYFKRVNFFLNWTRFATFFRVFAPVIGGAALLMLVLGSVTPQTLGVLGSPLFQVP